jgi:hypothetical protein
MDQLHLLNTNRCDPTNPFCPSGNCSGCKDGVKWCADPRCAPFCSECYIQVDQPTDHAISVVLIAFIAFTLAFILFVVYGPIEYEDVMSLV